MLRLINVKNTIPVKYAVHPTDHFQFGMVGSIAGIDATGEKICGVCKGNNPIGIIDDHRDQYHDTTLSSKKIVVWNTAILFETDMFENTGIYVSRNELGVSPKGLLSPALSDIRISGPVAKFQSFTNSKIKQTIICEWIPQIIYCFIPTTSLKTRQQGMLCSQCNTLNQYIDAGNQPDGGYICGPCRN